MADARSPRRQHFHHRHEDLTVRRSKRSGAPRTRQMTEKRCQYAWRLSATSRRGGCQNSDLTYYDFECLEFSFR
jgi:hypothetical protein